VADQLWFRTCIREEEEEIILMYRRRLVHKTGLLNQSLGCYLQNKPEEAYWLRVTLQTQNF